ncbi:MAG: Hint domain-containing protein [Sulfitobacter sp.]|jgi:hypothetical protein
MPSGTYTFTMYTISGSGNSSFTVTGSFTVTIFDSDDNFGVGDDQLSNNATTETGAPPVIQSLGPGAPSGWDVGDTFYFGGSRGIESGSSADDFLVPKVGGGWQTSTALYSLPGASIPLVVGESYTREGTAGNVNTEIAPCFTKGTMIKTDVGEVAVEDLEVGDFVLTLDCGFQPIRWVGSKTLDVTNKNAPVVFDKNTIGNESKLSVSPNHRMLVRSVDAELLFGASEILVAAKCLTMMKGVRRERPKEVTYIHILFDQHQIIYANGALSESFHPGTASLNALDVDTRNEVLEIFPELAEKDNNSGSTVRMCLKSYEVIALQNTIPATLSGL